MDKLIIILVLSGNLLLSKKFVIRSLALATVQVTFEMTRSEKLFLILYRKVGS